MHRTHSPIPPRVVDPTAGQATSFFCSSGVSYWRWRSSVLETPLFWRSLWRRLEGRCLHACFRFSCTVHTPAQRCRHASGERKGLQFHNFSVRNRDRNQTEYPPHTPCSQAKSEQAQTDWKEAHAHISRQALPTNLR